MYIKFSINISIGVNIGIILCQQFMQIDFLMDRNFTLPD